MGQAQSNEKPHNLPKLAEHFEFPQEDVQQWYQDFLSENPNGKVSHKKLIEFYQKLYPEGDPKPLCDDIFRLFDTNRDNSIDFTEFLTVIYLTKKGSNEDKCRVVFKLYDKDGKGKITRQRMIEVFESFGRMIGTFRLGKDKDDPMHSIESQVDDIFRKADKSRDGVLTIDEFVNYGKNHPTLLLLFTFDGTVTKAASV